MNTFDVAVVGAGISGLRVADRLLAAGRSVVVLEARDEIGGRLRTVGGVDLGASWFWPNEPRVQSLIEELGVRNHPHYRAGAALYQDTRGVQRLDGNPIDVESGRFSQGAVSLARALAERLPDGVVRTGTPVEAVRAPAAELVVLDTPDGEVRAGSVVLAMPPALAVDRIRFEPELPGDLVRLAESTPVWMGDTTKVVARYSRPFWRDAGLAGAAVSHVGPLREVHDLGGPDTERAALFGFAAPVGDWPAGEPERLVRDQLAALFGPEAADPERIQILDWSRDEWTVPIGRPNSRRFELFGHPAWSTPMHERIHLTSTETAPAFGGHIEGALLSADLTVERLLEPAPAP